MLIVFGPQKGADEKAVKHLDAGLRRLAQIVSGRLKTPLRGNESERPSPHPPRGIL